ncbi:unannotated protein [freshwater metagenome]|uniref:Unannotated protein n=1 Tax=freshwater metagenome TaxID=449393 RepID=A0A6J6HJ92_9ZZZZ
MNIQIPNTNALAITNFVERYFSIRGEKSAALSEPIAIMVPIRPKVVTPLSKTLVAMRALNS